MSGIYRITAQDSLIFRCVIPETILQYASAGRITKSAEERGCYGPVCPCALCERETVHPTPSAPVPPDPLPLTNRRPRTVNTSRHFCPHTACDYRGWRGLNNLRANGHPSGGPWRQFHCTACDGYFPEHHGTIFHGKQAAVELSVRVLAC